MVKNIFLTNGRCFDIPIADKVPTTVDIAVDNTATRTEVRTAANISRSLKSVSYHRVEKPLHDVKERELLKENTIITIIGP